jgi:hypothetical protein
MWLHHEASKPARSDDKFIEIDVFVDRKIIFSRLKKEATSRG